MSEAASCPACASENVVFSKKRKRHVCEDCGHEFRVAEPFVSHRVFISYGHDEHAALAVRLRDDLRARKHEAWFDGDRLKPGHDWKASIERGLAWAAEGRPHGAVVLLLTPYSVRRPDGYCLNEVAHALMLGLRIIPLMVVESEPPLSICRIQWLDMRECIPIHEKAALYAPKYERLLAALERNELDFEGTQSRLLRALQPIQFSADLLKLLRGFTGRRWVFDKVDCWFANPAGSKVFWLTGAPGVGKSAIAAWIREHRREIAAFHFCDINSEEKRNPAKLVCSIVYQLSTQLPEYEARLARLPLEAIVQEYHEAYTLFDRLLVQPLADAFPVSDRAIVVLIDALDEATADRRNEIVLFLGQCADKTPPWLRFLVTSRPEPEIVAAFQKFSPYVLDTGRPENLDDLREYLRAQMPGIADDQTAEILRRSEGVFLYVAHVVEELRAGTLSLARVDELPRGLGDVYQRFFHRQFGAQLADYETRIAPMLQAVFAAREPLTLGYLKTLLGIAEDTDLQRRLNRLGSLFPVSGETDDDTIRPFHRSLREWITNRAGAGHFVVAESDGHRMLAEHGLREYRRGVDALTPYALRHLPAHLSATGRWDDLVGNESTPGPLTDLLFIQAKCEAGLVHDLMTDYNAALAALPEFCEENERNRQRDAAMAAYNQALREYAVARCDWWFAKERGETRPEPPYPPLPAELQDDAPHAIPEDSSLRAARLRHFANFVNAHLGSLASVPQEVLPLAYNFADGGSVSADAEARIASREQPWLRRSPRPPVAPVRPQCLRILEGHGDYVTSVNISTDGRHAVSGSLDKTVRLWDMETGACLHTFKGHSSWVNSVCVSADGRRAVSGSQDHTIRIWDLETGQCLRILKGHSNWVGSVSINQDGRRAVSGSGDKTVRLWDLQTGQCLRILEGHSSGILSVSISPEGRRTVSGSLDGTVRLWDLETGQCLRTLEGHADWVWNVSESPDGCRAVSGSHDGTVRLWDLETGQCLRTFEGHKARVRGVSVSPDGRRAVSGSLDETVRLWNLETGDCLRTLKGHSSWVNSVSISQDGRRAISGSGDNTIRLWDLETGACICPLEGHSDGVRSVCVSPDGRCALSGSRDQTVRVWNLKTGACLRTLAGHARKVTSVSINTDGRHAVSASKDKTLRVWDLETGVRLRTLQGHFKEVSCVNLSPDGRRVISGSHDRTVRVWDLQTGACLRALNGHTNGVSSVNISPDGRRVISGSRDCTLLIWDLETGIRLRTLEDHSNWVSSVSVSPDGRRAVSGSDDKSLRVWDLESGACLRKLEDHSAGVNTVSVSPDGRRAVSGSDDSTLRVWELESGVCLRILAGHRAGVISVSVSPDGRRAVSGCNDKSLRVWDLKSGQCLAYYHAGADVHRTAFSSDGSRIVCGTTDGQMHFLAPVNFPPSGPPLITAVRLWRFGEATKQPDGTVLSAPGRWDDNLTCRCLHCGKLFEPPEPVLETGMEGAQEIRKGLWLPASASANPRLLAPCPHCGGALKFNPFVVDNK